MKHFGLEGWRADGDKFGGGTGGVVLPFSGRCETIWTPEGGTHIGFGDLGKERGEVVGEKETLAIARRKAGDKLGWVKSSGLAINETEGSTRKTERNGH